jgi:hypothetical protein
MALELAGEATGSDRDDRSVSTRATGSHCMGRISTFRCWLHSHGQPTTKQRLLFKYDGYMVWSEQGRRELYEFYPETREMPVYVVGAPQFDVCFNRAFLQTREEFCAAQGLRPELPMIVHSLGSPNFLREYHGAVALAERVVQGELGNVQLLVRPHPAKDRGEMTDVFRRYQPRVVLQEVSEEASGQTEHSGPQANY